ncbi:hypothetical protein [Streptomyces rishiriensis]|uniref:Uncharacterized protein n=1 Tax=Streptomyces rishiriensis TaxID=68264 RepID=A0ABU0NHZ2_STRRH|nr:hypothetical protein [Streptomyces rishiriensis]MDQ0578685.1 hypothetical protein [Streptomyces rishiriensis]
MLRQLGTAWETGAQERTHASAPAVPRRPPGNAVLGVPLSLYDRMRDALGVGNSAKGVKKVPIALAGVLMTAAAAASCCRASGAEAARSRALL